MDQKLYTFVVDFLLGSNPNMKYLLFVFLASLEALLMIEQEWEYLLYHLLLSLLLIFWVLRIPSFSSKRVYLVDFSCYEPPNFCRVPFSTFLEHVQMLDFLDEESVAFMTKVLTHSGQGERTCLPPAVHYIPPRSGHQEAIEEVHMVLFPVFEQLLSKTNLSPSQIDILIVNCSGFSPSPSLSSIIVNKYSMREDVKTFNLTGMGCSASAIAIDMAHNLLKTRKNSNAVILSTEILSTGWYPGKSQPMMILNCLFRMGAAGILLTNHEKRFKNKSKYKLVLSQRTQRASDDKGYYSAIREEDSDGLTGVTLRRDLLQVASETLRSNITILGGKILPVTELIFYGASIIRKKYLQILFKEDKPTNYYLPNFKTVIQHFCLPVSGKAVIREIGKGLKLGEREMEPALMTLHRFGNQSSSSLWYELGYMEAKERVKKGDRVWQLGMGTGPKCSSLVWECINPISGESHRGPWADSLHCYPI